MPERLPTDPPLVDVDLLKYMNEAADFWDEVAILNLRLGANLNAEDDPVSPADASAEEAHLQRFHSKYFGAELVERAAFLLTTVDAETDADEPAALTAISARFLGCTPEAYTSDIVVDRETVTVIAELGTRVVAFVFETEDNAYTIPIHKDYIASLSVETERGLNEEPTLADRLKNRGRVVRHLTHTRTFLAADFQTQNEQVLTALDYTKNLIPEFSEFENTKHLVIAKNDEGETILLAADQLLLVFPDMADRSTPFRSPDDYDYGGELCLIVSKDDVDEPHLVPLSCLIDIVKDSEPDLGNAPIDALHGIFSTEKVAHIIAFYEKMLNDATTDSEFTKIAMQAETALIHAIPRHVLDLGVYVEGKLYRDIELLDDTVQTVLCEDTLCQNATFCDFGVNFIDGRWRITLALEVTDEPDEPSDDEFLVGADLLVADKNSETGDDEREEDRYETDEEESDDSLDSPVQLIFIVPNRDYTDSLWLAENSEIGPQDVIDNFRQCEEQIKALLVSQSFLKADRPTQNVMIEQLLEATNDILEAYLTQDADIEYEFDYTVSQYRRIKLTAANAPTQTIAKKPLIRSKDCTLRGHKARVAVPETQDDTLEPFRSPEDFPLSHGLPMLIVDDRKKRACYFVSLPDVSALMPFALGESED